MGFLSDLFDRFHASQPAQTLLSQLAAGSTRVGGCHGSFARLTGAAVAKSHHMPLLYVTPDSESAAIAASDLSYLLDEEISAMVELPEFYLGISPHPQIAADLVLNLFAAGKGKPLVIPVRALLYLLPPSSWFLKQVIALDKGEEYDLIELLRRMVSLGYRRGTRVEVPGEVAQRGGIVDIFPNGEVEPLRLEFDGDQIAGIRSFDPITQLSRSETFTAVIKPMRVLLVPSGSDECLRSILHARQQKSPDEIISRLAESRFKDGDEAYLPWLHEQLSTILDYFPQKPLLIVEDPEQCLSNADEIWDKAEDDHTIALAKGIIYPAPEELLGNEEEIIRQNRNLLLYSSAQSGTVNFLVQPEEMLHGNTELLHRALNRLYAEGYDTVLLSNTPGGVRRLEEIISAKPAASGTAQVVMGNLFTGFAARDLHQAVLTDAAIFGRTFRRHIKKHISHPDFSSSRALASINDLLPGDFVVHVNHGIGRYEGTRLIPIDGVLQDFLHITYRDDAKLYVPIHDISHVQKYMGKDGVVPTLERLGGLEWQRTTEKVRRSLRILAGDLIKLYASRVALPGFAFPKDTTWMEELEESFPYEETPDQAQAIEAVKGDMESAKPMERLLCGDVGFGKTEVAIRAAFKCVLGGKQCAVLVPTTILAAQHYATFSERLSPFPVRIEMLSRFRSRKEQLEILKQMAASTVDIVIGTHRLLSKDIVFRDLGLLVVDEEHRFGVGHKEKIKKFRETVDVLTMTATPIPRTLSFALGGARDLNLIETAPAGRLPILTTVHTFDPVLIDEAVATELKRDGQVFFVHNRVENIHAVAGWLAERMPTVRFGVGHGQMEEKELERVMDEFLNRHYDVLVTTTIIESGLDIQNANTIIINHADRFGLAQLHQLRGRVGRSERQAYCYLLVPPRSSLPAQARRRLDAIAESTELGSGFRLALRDLEIRGAGNMLGAEQHGHIAEIGYELYVQMLEEEVARLKQEPLPQITEVRMEMSVPAYLPESYVPDEGDRLELYSRLMKPSGGEDLGKLESEIRDRFGAPPPEVELLLEVAAVRQMAAIIGISLIKIEGPRTILKMDAQAIKLTMQLKTQLSVDRIKLTPQQDGCFILEMEIGSKTPKEALEKLGTLLEKLFTDKSNNLSDKK